MIEELAYSIHLGADRNKSAKAKEIAKTNPSNTTSFSNNGIQNLNIKIPPLPIFPYLPQQAIIQSYPVSHSPVGIFPYLPQVAFAG